MASSALPELRRAARALRRSPGVTAVSVLVLALGIGAGSAVFSVLEGVFLEPLPYPEPDELIYVWQTTPNLNRGAVSGPDYLDWREEARAFEALAAMRPTELTLAAGDRTLRLGAMTISPEGFEVLGVEPALGRAFTPADQEPEDPDVVILSHRVWSGSFQSDPGAIGRSVEVDGRLRTVVGVMPEGFDIPSPWGDPDEPHDLYVPFSRSSLTESRGSRWFYVLGRLRGGVEPGAADAEMDDLMRRLEEAYPTTNAGRRARVVRMHDQLYGDAGRRLFLVLGAAGLFLLVGCGNVAGVQLARATSRRRELAIRTALGARRLRVARELMLESLLLAALGGAVGVALAWGVLEGLRSLLAASLPRISGVGLDPAVLAFAGCAALVTAVVFGTAPALTVRRMDLSAPLREGGDRGSSDARSGLRGAFIVGQLALSLVLANGAALLIQSYANLRSEARGFEPDGVLTFTAVTAGPAYDDPLDRARHFDRVREEVASTPGVVAVGATTKLPWYGGTNTTARVDGEPMPERREDLPLVELSAIQGAYFRAMGIPVLRGRPLLPEDSASASPGVVVNRTLAERFWPGEDPLGRRFSFSIDEPVWHTVVGVVEDVRQWGPERPVLPEAYLPYTTNPWSRLYVVARTAGEPAALEEPVRRAVVSVDPQLPPADFRTMEERVASRLGERRSYTGVVGLFALLAVSLAAAGVYGTVSYFVARRTREIGVRIALGSSPGRVIRLVGGRAARLAVLGVALGVAGAFATRTVISSVVYGIGPVDGGTLAVTSLVLVATVLAGAAVPSLRAASVPPVEALRAE